MNRDEVPRQGVLTPKCLRPMGIAKSSLVQDQGNDVFHWSKYKCLQMIDWFIPFLIATFPSYADHGLRYLVKCFLCVTIWGPITFPGKCCSSCYFNRCERRGNSWSSHHVFVLTHQARVESSESRALQRCWKDFEAWKHWKQQPYACSVSTLSLSYILSPLKNVKIATSRPSRALSVE